MKTLKLLDTRVLAIVTALLIIISMIVEPASAAEIPTGKTVAVFASLTQSHAVTSPIDYGIVIPIIGVVSLLIVAIVILKAPTGRSTKL